MSRKISLFFIFTISSFLFAPQVLAAAQFKTSTQIDYRYDDQGNSQVTQNISLVNITPGRYPSSYELQLKGTIPKNLTGLDSEGPLKFSQVQISPDICDVKIEFNHVAAGLGQTQTFTLSYDGNPAQKTGQIWEIVIPRFDNIQVGDTYSFHLYIPDSFGKTAYISPLPDSIDKTSALGFSKNIFNSAQNSAAETGIIAAFGDFQIFDFNLNYSLYNPTISTSHQSIALPADTAYQKLFYSTLKPKPDNVVTDVDGNWLAEYSIPPKSSQNITAIGQAHILSSPINPVMVPSSAELSKYLQPAQYWPTTDPLIQNLSQKLKTPREIFDYVVNSLDYDKNRVGTISARKGGVAALSSPKSSLSTEFTDAFVTLTRAAGIPAREINGFALSTDQNLQPLSLLTDILHAWPEYWDSTAQTWRWVDPTWAKTTGEIDFFNQIDLSHFAFVTHGISSTLPLSTAKDIQVSPGKYQDYFSRSPETFWHRPFQLFPFITNTSTINIINSNGVAIDHIPVSTSFSPGLLHSDFSTTIPVIPPFGRINQSLSFSPRLFPSFTPQYFTVKVGLTAVTYNVPESLYYFWYGCFIFITTGFIVALAALAASSWNLYLQRRRR